MATMAELLARARAAREALQLQEQEKQNVIQSNRLSSDVRKALLNVGKTVEQNNTQLEQRESDADRQNKADLREALIPHAQFSGDIELNTKQSEFRDLVLSGKDCVLIGAAGTGKTTCLKAVIQALAQQPGAVTLQGGHKYLVNGTPSTILTSFTRRAVNNLKRAVSADFKSNCITLHKLLEYQPHYYEIIDPETGDERNTMRFEPSRTSMNPLDPSIKALVIDEASMVSLELEEEVNVALPHKVQKIYLG